MVPLVLDTDFFTASPCIDCDVPGYLVLIAKTKTGDLSQLNSETLDTLGSTLGRLEASIKKITDAEHVYVLRFSEGLASVHFHLFPRTAELGKQWLAAAKPPDRNLNGPYLFGWARLRFHVNSPDLLSGETLRIAALIGENLRRSSR